MIKFYQTLTNKRGDSLAGYRVQVVDESTGASVPIYADGSGTPFSGSVNYATADSEGLVEFYWSPAAGQVLQTLDPAGNLVKAVADFADSLTGQDAFVGATGDGATNDSPALIAAIAARSGNLIRLGSGTFLLGTSLGTIPANTHIVGAGKGATIIKKGFNGDIATLGLNCTVTDTSVDGNGATYTGRGFVITDGSAAGTGYQKLTRVSIYNMEGYCVEWTQNAAGWGGGMRDCDVQRVGNLTACLKMPDTETNGNRSLISTFAGSGPLVDFAGAANVQLSDCTAGSGGGAVNAFTMTAGSAKIQIVNCRFAVGGGTTTLLGENHTFVANSHAGPFNLGNGVADSLVNSRASGNDFAGYTVTYDANVSTSANANTVEMPLSSFVPAWTATGTAPAIGNGSINSSYSRSGVIVTLTIELTAGGTTTFGTGGWSFSLPVKAAARKAIGSATMLDSSAGLPYAGAVRIEENATTLQIYPNAANIVQSNSPFTWASGDTLMLTISYFAA